MRRQNPFFSLVSCLSALIMLVGLALALLFTGGMAFSPGLLSAEAGRGTPLEGADSHVTIEPHCARCHVPFHGISEEKCTTCHTTEGDELDRGEGLHGKLINGHDCAACHSDHRGRDALISQTDPLGFEHQWTGYSLSVHQTTYNDLPFNCRECHLGRRFTFEQQTCTTCHAEADATFRDTHLQIFGDDCLACHDGEDTMARFDHEVVFPLVDGHAGPDCIECHDTGFLETSAECATCHEEPVLHAGKFGPDCAVCHTLVAWTPARLIDHTFPLDHGGDGEVECITCHELDYVTYTCYGCHDHEPDENRLVHLEAEIRDIENCAECHPTGLELDVEGKEAATGFFVIGNREQAIVKLHPPAFNP